jgi:hypothetical protein
LCFVGALRNHIQKGWPPKTIEERNTWINWSESSRVIGARGDIFSNMKAMKRLLATNLEKRSSNRDEQLRLNITVCRWSTVSSGKNEDVVYTTRIDFHRKDKTPSILKQRSGLFENFHRRKDHWTGKLV